MYKVIASAAVLAFVASNASAGLYMKVDGVAGPSTAKGRNGWIDLQSATDGLTSPKVQGGSGIGAGKPAFADVAVTKQIDETSPLFRGTASTGKRYKSVVIEATSSGAQETLFWRITLEDVGVTAANGVAPAQGSSTEGLAFSYRTISWEYFPQDKSGAALPPVKTSAILY